MEPVNIAGLCEGGKKNWYRADAADAIAGAAKLGVAEETVADTLVAIGLSE